jgi:restriction system protein
MNVVFLAKSRLNSSSCSVFLLDDNQLVLRASTVDDPASVKRVKYRAGEGLTGWVAKHRRPLVIKDLTDFPDDEWRVKLRFGDQPPSSKSFCACPILHANSMFGVLRVSRDAPYAFSDLNELTVISKQLAWALSVWPRKDMARREVEQLFKPDIVRIELISAIDESILRYLNAHPNEIYRLDPIRFEELIAEILRREGWQVQLTVPTRDGGYDMVAVQRIGGVDVQLLAEAKRYRPDRPVGVGAIRQLWAVKQRRHASKALLATTSYVSGPAKLEYRDVIPYELEIKEYDSLVAWLSSTINRSFGGNRFT